MLTQSNLTNIQVTQSNSLIRVSCAIFESADDVHKEGNCSSSRCSKTNTETVKKVKAEVEIDTITFVVLRSEAQKTNKIEKKFVVEVVGKKE